jgi:hypothetical protein
MLGTEGISRARSAAAGWRRRVSVGREVPIKRRTGPSDLVRYSHLGFQFALTLFLAVLGGVQLDKRFSTDGVFTLLGTFVGAGIGFYVLSREARSARRPDSGGDGGGDARDGGADRSSGGPDGRS